MEDAIEGAVAKEPPHFNRKLRIFRLLSRVNGWSLVLVGLVSFGISVYAGSIAGTLISAALALHGALELGLSKKAAAGEWKSATRRMAFNQVALAVSLSLYFAYQIITLDEEALMTQLAASPIYDILLLYPVDLRYEIIESLPFLIGLFYGVAALISWIFCVATAIYYWTQGR